MAGKLSDFLFETDKILKQRGIPEGLTDETLRELATQFAQHPGVTNAIQSGEISPSFIADEAMQAIQAMKSGTTVQGSVGGGLIGDTTGAGTQQIRQQFGIPSPPLTPTPPQGLR